MRSSLKLKLLSNASIILVWKELSRKFVEKVLTRLLLLYERNASTQSQRCFENLSQILARKLVHKETRENKSTLDMIIVTK